MSAFDDTLSAALRDIQEHGFDSDQRVRMWMDRLRLAAAGALIPESQLTAALRQTLVQIYRRQIDMGGLARYHPGIARYQIDQLAPAMRAELDRRILASANLIKLNRQQAVETTLRRFSGWATSIPAGGSKAVDRRAEKALARKPLAQLPFIERRVAIDQGHKFVAALNQIVAQGNGAIAAEWHSHWRQPGYNYREEHKERDGLIYLIRDSWARDDGLVKAGPAGFYDQITKPGEEVFCRCAARYLYNIRLLPDDMLTKKGLAMKNSPLREAAWYAIGQRKAAPRDGGRCGRPQHPGHPPEGRQGIHARRCRRATVRWRHDPGRRQGAAAKAGPGR